MNLMKPLRHIGVVTAGGDCPGMNAALRAIVDNTLKRQEDLGLDVLVHGEAERNDMVEYFGELLEGMLVTSEGWVQSYGSRCVRPPIIVGDISRPAPMTVKESKYAVSISKKPMKGMLTGPITCLRWSFPRGEERWSPK